MLLHPLLEDCRDIRPEWRASHLASLPKAANVGACAEHYVLAPKRRNLAVAEAGLDRHEQKRSVPSSDPRRRIGCCNDGSALFFGQEFHRAALMALRRNRQYALALQRQCWFTDGNVLEERVHGGEAIVSGPRAVAAHSFEVVEERAQEGRIEVFDT
jgi:hypothetical protein